MHDYETYLKNNTINKTMLLNLNDYFLYSDNRNPQIITRVYHQNVPLWQKRMQAQAIFLNRQDFEYLKDLVFDYENCDNTDDAFEVQRNIEDLI